MKDAEHGPAHPQRLDSLGQLTGGLAHDFNNLLTVIQGNLQALQELPTVERDAACAPLLHAALRATQRGAELTRSLLMFARRRTLAPSAVDAGATLAALLTMLRRTLDQHVQLSLKVAPSCPACVADPALLEATLMNLALNSRDAMPDGGKLSCWVAACDQLPEEARAEFAADEGLADGYVAISMADTGTGMTAEVLERAFEPFFTTKPAGQGTGMGLSAAYGFARQSNGAIVINSSPVSGTCVTLYLPRERRAAARPAAEPEQTAAALQGLSVMLVEDDLEVMAVTLSYMRQLGCDVRAYGSGEHALLALERDEPPSLLVTDLGLGEGMRGEVLARHVLERWPWVSVLLISGQLTALDIGVTGRASLPALEKPFSLAQLGSAMSQAIGRRNA